MSKGKQLFGLACVFIAIVIIAWSANNIYQAHLKVVEAEEQVKIANDEMNKAFQELDQTTQQLNSMNS